MSWRKTVLVLLVLVASPFAIPHRSAASPSYNTSLRPGDQATYQMSGSWVSPVGSPVLPLIGQFLHIASTGFLVETVSGIIVTMAQTLNYSNQTTKTVFLTGDMATGNGNLTFWTIPGGLSVGDQISSSNTSPTINVTGTQTAVGVLREFNGYQYSAYLATLGITFQQQRYFSWDKATGILIGGQINFGAYNTTGSQLIAQGYGTVQLTSTNLWSSTPDFKINASTLIQTISSGTSGTIRLSALPLQGFTGTIDLSSTSAQGLQVSQPSQTSVTIPPPPSGSTTVLANWTITAPRTLPEGTYTQRLTASSNGGPSHTLPFTIIVSGDFSLNALPYAVVSAGLGSTTIPVEIASSGLTGPVQLTATVSQSGPIAALANTAPVLSPGSTVYTNLTLSANRGTPPGNYTLTIKATKGSLTHSTNSTFRVYDAPQTTSLSSKMLGLDPIVFYAVIASGAIAAAIVIIAARLRTRRQTPQPRTGLKVLLRRSSQGQFHFVLSASLA